MSHALRKLPESASSNFPFYHRKTGYQPDRRRERKKKKKWDISALAYCFFFKISSELFHIPPEKKKKQPYS